MVEKTKKRLNWALDKLNDIALGGYALLTGEKWVKTLSGTLSIPEVAKVVLVTLLLFTVWAIIGLFKGLLEDEQ